MSEQPGIPGPHEMRASNADRERFSKILHDAMSEGRLTVGELEERLDQVYAAKTYGDLIPVVRDLPGHQVVPRLQQPLATPAPNRVGGRGTSSSAIAIMSGSDRRGPWVVPPTFNAIAIMGGVEIDLTQATFEAAETVIQAYALMGGVEIRVPEGITVVVDGIGFMGGFANSVRTQGPPGSPVVRITGFAMWGGVDVKPPRRRKGRHGHQEIED
ncbi:DUF1707 SHOCT-like domain-containing protein [Actinokineospora alba]|nr:DUF1707 domain-containing protein [Actinokineospora alba]TDP65322.1 cell wall-active antibiotic response 4TMS protein YvqF [Actinokineospora alba]